MEKVNITIVGAGVVGLAISEELSKVGQDILVLEKNSSFGQETSSRNSEVIHAGIYYPKDTLKTQACIEGRRLLYEYCLRNDIPCKKIGKLIVAINAGEVNDLHALLKRGLENGVADLKLLSKEEVKRIEPDVECAAAIYSPSTGILDTHSFMKRLSDNFQGHNGIIAYNTELIGVDKIKDGFSVRVEDKREGVFEFSTRVLINCSGLNSDKVCAMFGIKDDKYKLKYSKGDYFRVSQGKAKRINRLIYPVPKPDRSGLGVHATLDLSGGLRLGPDDEYVDRIDYLVDASKAAAFYESVKNFLPFIELEDISPDTSGIRPKLQGHKEAFRDFIIKDEAERGLKELINLIGIESPGLTCSLSIARMVKEMAMQVIV